MVTVISLGAGPGLNFDLATFSFHVPFAGSLSCASTTLDAAHTNATARNPRTHGLRDTRIADLQCCSGTSYPFQPRDGRVNRAGRVGLDSRVESSSSDAAAISA